MIQRQSKCEAINLLSDGVNAIKECRAERLPRGCSHEYFIDQAICDAEQFIEDGTMPTFEYSEMPLSHYIRVAAAEVSHNDGKNGESDYHSLLHATFELIIAVQHAAEYIRGLKAGCESDVGYTAYERLESRVGFIHRALSQIE